MKENNVWPMFNYRKRCPRGHTAIFNRVRKWGKNICVILFISIGVVENNRKARKTQTTSCENQGIEKGMSEQTNSCILEQMGCSRRPHWVRLLSAKKQEIDAINFTGSPKLDHRRRKKIFCGSVLFQ